MYSQLINQVVVKNCVRLTLSKSNKHQMLFLAYSIETCSFKMKILSIQVSLTQCNCLNEKPNIMVLN